MEGNEIMDDKLNYDEEINEIRVYTTKEVAQILRISESHVYRLIKNGRIEKLPLGQRIIRISEKSLNNFLNTSY
jgi:excisionase family DNA binding protein